MLRYEDMYVVVYGTLPRLPWTELGIAGARLLRKFQYCFPESVLILVGLVELQWIDGDYK